MGFRIRSRLLFFFAALVAAFVALAPASEATYPGENGKIAFVGDEPYEIYTVNPEGSDLTQLTPTNAGDRDPAWSADGQKIAFTRGSYGDAEIYTMNPDGSGVRQLTDDAVPESEPAWSPDGRQLAFVSDGPPSGSGIYVMRADGTEPTFLKAGWDPAWSPNGKKIAFTAPEDVPRAARQELHIMNADGTGDTLLSPGSNVYDLSWSPVGERLAVGGCDREFGWPCGIGVTNADGIGSVGLTPRGGFVGDYSPTWSPDGRKIAFHSCTGDGSDPNQTGPGETVDFGLYTISPDGTGRAKFLERFGSQLDWQPIPNNPSRFQNRPAFCRAQRGALGGESFAKRYSSFGKCVSQAR